MTVPAHVELLVAYANSVDHDEGTDDLTTPTGLSVWLLAHGLLARRTRATAADLDLALRQAPGAAGRGWARSRAGPPGSPWCPV